MKQKKNKGKYKFSINKDVYKEYSLICKKLGLIRSRQIENYMREFIEKWKE